MCWWILVKKEFYQIFKLSSPPKNHWLGKLVRKLIGSYQGITVNVLFSGKVFYTEGKLTFFTHVRICWKFWLPSQKQVFFSGPAKNIPGSCRQRAFLVFSSVLTSYSVIADRPVNQSSPLTWHRIQFVCAKWFAERHKQSALLQMFFLHSRSSLPSCTESKCLI